MEDKKFVCENCGGTYDEEHEYFCEKCGSSICYWCACKLGRTGGDLTICTDCMENN